MLRNHLRIRFDAQEAIRRMQARQKDAMPILSKQVLDDCNRYARDDTGRLIQSAYGASDFAGGRLIWRTAYARRVYYTGRPSTRVNGAASLRWCEKAKATHLAQWESLAQRTVGGETA